MEPLEETEETIQRRRQHCKQYTEWRPTAKNTTQNTEKDEQHRLDKKKYEHKCPRR